MASELVHRGPDTSGTFVRGSIGLAFRRLAVIDLSPSANQPMVTPEGGHAIVFNGEIYNHAEFRARLEHEGSAPAEGWRTGSDTETLLHACIAWGVAEACQKANGMFAFAFWDDSAQRLTLARDRVGKKPMFLARDEGRGVAFASELRALRAAWPLRDRPPALDRQRLCAFLCYGFPAGHETLYAGVERLPPGHVMDIDVRNGIKIGEPRRFYDFDFALGGSKSSALAPACAHTRIADETVAVAELHDLLKDAVQLRLISDVPFGAFLSGGLDSSAIVALMAQLHPEPIKTYTIGFATGVSEGRYAAEVAHRFGTDHHELKVDAEQLVSAIPAALWCRESPISEASDVPIFLLSRLARQKVTVVLSGEGADETFAGYPKYAATAVADRWPFSWLQQLPGARSGLALAARGLPPRARRLQTALQAFSLPDRLERHAAWFGAFNVRERRELLTPAVLSESEWLVHQSADKLLRGRQAPSDAFPSTVEEAMYLDLREWLPADLLLRGDRMTMAHSLELRCPFLDPRLIEFAARCVPLKMKVRGQHVKRILRKMAEQRLGLPAYIVHRDKWGFKVPIGEWFRGEVLGPSLRAILFSPAARSRRWYQETTVERLVEDHIAGRANHTRKLWILYQLELWHQMFVDGTLAPTDELPR